MPESNEQQTTPNVPLSASSNNPTQAKNDLPPSYDEAMRNAVSHGGEKTSMFSSSPSTPVSGPSPSNDLFHSTFPAPFQPPMQRHPYQYHTLGPQTVAIPIGDRGYYTPVDSRESVRIKCPNCRRIVYTNVEAQYSPTVWLSALCLCLCGLPMCCFIPFCIPDCMDFQHTCPNCNQIIDVYKPYAL